MAVAKSLMLSFRDENLERDLLNRASLVCGNDACKGRWDAVVERKLRLEVAVNARTGSLVCSSAVKYSMVIVKEIL